MTYDEHEDKLMLSTGRRFYAHAGILGLNGDTVTGGYDETVYMPGVSDWADAPEDRWTVAERRELADYMIARWTAWREKQV